jgi:hypothetical protein
MEPPPVAAIDHALQEKVHALELQRAQLVEFLLFHFEQLGHRCPSGTVDRNVDAAAALPDEIGEGGDFGALGDVAYAVLCLYGIGESLQRSFAAAGDDDSSPFAREATGDNLTHVAVTCGTENHRHFTVDTSHVFPLECCDVLVLDGHPPQGLGAVPAFGGAPHEAIEAQ